MVKGYPYVSEPRLFPPDHMGNPVEPPSNADPRVLATYQARLAAWARCLPILTNSQAKKLVKNHAHPNKFPYVAHITGLAEAPKKDQHQADWSKANMQAVCTDACFKGMNGVLTREHEVLRMLSTLHAAADASSPEEVKDAVMAAAQVLVHHMHINAELQREWIELLVFNRHTPLPKPESVNLSIDTLMIRSAAGAAAQATHAAAIETRSVYGQSATDQKGIPQFDSLSPWPLQNTLSIRRVLSPMTCPRAITLRRMMM